MEIREALVILYVSDQKRSADFYSRILEMEPVLDVPGMTEFQIHPGLKLGIMPEKGIAQIITPALPDPATGAGIPRCELYLVVADADKSFSHAVEMGAKIVSAPSDHDWGHRVGYLADPDGHVIAFASILK